MNTQTTTQKLSAYVSGIRDQHGLSLEVALTLQEAISSLEPDDMTHVGLLIGDAYAAHDDADSAGRYYLWARGY